MTTTALTFNVDLSKATSSDQNVMEIPEVSFALTTEHNGQVENHLYEGTVDAMAPLMLSHLKESGTTKVVTWHLGFMLEYIQHQLDLRKISLSELFRVEDPIACQFHVGLAFCVNPVRRAIHFAARNHHLMLDGIRFTDLLRERYKLQRAVQLPPDKTYAFSAIAKRTDIVPNEAEGLKGRELAAWKMKHMPELVAYEAFEENIRLLIMDKSHRAVVDCLNYNFS